MPYRNLPPHKRPWREQRTGFWFLLCVAIGFLSLPYPSAALHIAVASGVMAISALWIALGSVGFVAWVKGYRDAELMTMRGVAALMFVHGIAVALFAGNGGYQTGLIIAAAGLGTLAWGRTRYEFGLSRKAVEEAVEKVNGNGGGDDHIGRSG